MTPLNDRGQMTIEMVLLVTLIVGIAMTIANTMQTNKSLQTLMAGPWPYLQGMIESGVWDRAPAARLQHPNSRRRQQSVAGDE